MRNVQISFNAHSFNKYNRRLRYWGPTAAVWGVAAGAAVSFFLSEVPIFQKDVLIKVPVVSSVFGCEDSPLNSIC